MMRQLEAADALRCRAGESAPLVAEHLAFDEIARDRRTIHANERLVASGAAVVDGAGHELLAGSRFSGDKDARIGRRHPRDHLPHRVHRLARSHHLAGESQLRSQRPRNAARLTQLER